jgi:hypothetical protein
MKHLLSAVSLFFRAMVLGGRAVPKTPGYDPNLSTHR